MKTKISQVLVGVVVISVALLVALSLYYFRPSPQKGQPASRVSLVETIPVKRESKTLKLAAFGTVQPNRELTVQAEVKGRVIELSPNLDAGGILKKDEVMLKLDPRDYVAAVEQNRAKVEKAEFDLIVEKGRKIIAEKEWTLLDPSLKQGGLGKDLALRIPHLREKESALQGAQSALQKSLVDLKRTVIKAPFNALVLQEFVEIGQLVGALKDIAKLVSTDEFRVQVSVPYDQLEWVKIPEKKGDIETPVTIVQDLGDNDLVKREGHILRILGDLDPNGRMVQLLIVIDDPLNLHSKDSDKIPLLLGTYVEVLFEGPKIENVVEVPRLAIREGNTAWVMNKAGKLEIRKVEVISGDKHNVIIESGLEDGDALIISNLSVAIPGMDLRDISDVINEETDTNQ
ncbi:MAG: efflux RND transporter periplasmic adaptor subunit [Chlamydiota bacterium]